MPSIAFAMPRAEGAEDHAKELVQALTGGEVGRSVHEARKAHGFDRVKVWQQESPRMTIVYLEAPDLQAAFKALAEEDQEHHKWALDKIAKIIGRHPGDHSSRPNSKLLIDWHPEKGHSATHH